MNFTIGFYSQQTFLTCRCRKSNDGCFPSSVPGSLSGKPACTIPNPGTGTQPSLMLLITPLLCHVKKVYCNLNGFDFYMIVGDPIRFYVHALLHKHHFTRQELLHFSQYHCVCCTNLRFTNLS